MSNLIFGISKARFFLYLILGIPIVWCQFVAWYLVGFITKYHGPMDKYFEECLSNDQLIALKAFVLIHLNDTFVYWSVIMGKFFFTLEAMLVVFLWIRWIVCVISAKKAKKHFRDTC